MREFVIKINDLNNFNLEIKKRELNYNLIIGNKLFCYTNIIAIKINENNLILSLCEINNEYDIKIICKNKNDLNILKKKLEEELFGK